MDKKTTTFEESYLVPKATYEKLMGKKIMPYDVRLKNWDYRKRFQDTVPSLPSPKAPLIPPDKKRERQVQAILNSVNNTSRRRLALKLLKFIDARGGGTIDWTDNYEVTLDGERIYNLDIRDAIRHLVGEDEDPQGKTWAVYQRLVDLDAPHFLVRFYTTDYPRRTYTMDYTTPLGRRYKKYSSSSSSDGEGYHTTPGSPRGSFREADDTVYDDYFRRMLADPNKVLRNDDDGGGGGSSLGEDHKQAIAGAAVPHDDGSKDGPDDDGAKKTPKKSQESKKSLGNPHWTRSRARGSKKKKNKRKPKWEPL